jgi:hypothetical protein
MKFLVYSKKMLDYYVELEQQVEDTNILLHSALPEAYATPMGLPETVPPAAVRRRLAKASDSEQEEKKRSLVHDVPID